MTWCPPPIALKWGAYFQPDADDDAKATDTAIKAHDGGIVTLRSAVERVKRTFNIENVDQYLVTLEEERAAKQERLAADMHAMGGDAEDDDENGGDEPGKVVSTTDKTVGTVVPKKKPVGE